MLRCRFFVRLKSARLSAIFCKTHITGAVCTKIQRAEFLIASSKLRTPLLLLAQNPSVLCVFWSTDDRLPSTDCGRGAPEKKDRKNRILVFPVLLVSPVTLVTPVTPVTLAPLVHGYLC